jgi:hypothetical protein
MQEFADLAQESFNRMAQDYKSAHNKRMNLLKNDGKTFKS